MSDLYDDAIFKEAAGRVHDIGCDLLCEPNDRDRNEARIFLDALAPLIAAKALRDAAEATYEHTTITNDGRRIKTNRPVWGIGERQLLHRRADEIERGRS